MRVRPHHLYSALLGYDAYTASCNAYPRPILVQRINNKLTISHLLRDVPATCEFGPNDLCNIVQHVIRCADYIPSTDWLHLASVARNFLTSSMSSISSQAAAAEDTPLQPIPASLDVVEQPLLTSTTPAEQQPPSMVQDRSLTEQAEQADTAAALAIAGQALTGETALVT